VAAETAYQRITGALRARGHKVTENGHKASARCPAHDDRNASLSVTGMPEKTLIHCHAGCDTRDILADLELTLADLYDERSATYRYDDGRIVKRFYDSTGTKKFTQANAGPTSTLYHASRIAEAPPLRNIYIVEGEADVHTIEAMGGYATTAPQGAKSFHKVDVEPLRGRRVIVVVDRDDAGTTWAQQVRAKLDNVVEKMRFVHARTGKDASDHFAAGHNFEHFEAHEPPAPEEDTPTTRVKLTKASAIPMKGTRWVYRGRIPHGMVTLLAGREGIGKSTVSLDIAAQLTRGDLPGRFEGKPQPVIICATEDSWSHTIVPRLMAVKADMDRVYHIAVQDEDGNSRGIIAPQDTHRMETAFQQVHPALMLIDPLMAVIDGKIDTHKQAEVQQALEPLVKMCDRIGMAVLAVIHVNKSSTTDPLTSIMGSKAFATLPRSVLYCLEEDEGKYMFCHVKCNVGPKQPSIQYQLRSVRFELPHDQVEDGDDPYIESSRVVWGDEDRRTATELLEAKAQRSKLGDAAQAVLDLIDAEKGVLTAQQIRDKLSHLDYKAVENALLRLAKDKKITRAARGTYQSLAVTPNPHPNPHLSGDDFSE
jgi:hypothetical protein